MSRAIHPACPTAKRHAWPFSKPRARFYWSSSSGARCRNTRAKAGSLQDLLASRLPDVLTALQTAHPGVQAGFGFNFLVFFFGIRVLLSGLTPAGVAHAFFLGGSIFSAFGWGGYLLVCLYFVLGSAVTKLKLKEKEAAGIAEKRSGRRSPGSVWGSGIAGVACAWAALYTGNYALWQVGFVASFGSKLADTVSSEVGKAYGKTTFLVTTLQQVPRGTEGAVSLEGTAGGVAAAFGYAILATAIGQVDLTGAVICAVAATVANLFESYLGASVQGQVEWLTNDVVNMIQITLAAAIAIALTAGLRGY